MRKLRALKKARSMNSDILKADPYNKEAIDRVYELENQIDNEIDKIYYLAIGALFGALFSLIFKLF